MHEGSSQKKVIYNRYCTLAKCFKEERMKEGVRVRMKYTDPEREHRKREKDTELITSKAIFPALS